MKNLKEYFKLVITAVICFATNLLSGKNTIRKIGEVFTVGQAGAVNRNNVYSMFHCENRGYVLKNEGRMVENFIHKRSLFLKKVFFWLQGPGDKPSIRAGNIP